MFKFVLKSFSAFLIFRLFDNIVSRMDQNLGFGGKCGGKYLVYTRYVWLTRSRSFWGHLIGGFSIFPIFNNLVPSSNSRSSSSSNSSSSNSSRINFSKSCKIVKKCSIHTINESTSWRNLKRTTYSHQWCSYRSLPSTSVSTWTVSIKIHAGNWGITQDPSDIFFLLPRSSSCLSVECHYATLQIPA